MKNFINRALVAKKHLKLFFALFAMLALNVGNAWGEDVTFNFKTIAQTSGTTGGISWTTGKTGSATTTACNSTNGLVLYGVTSGGGYFQTTSPTSGAITNVSITSSAKKNTPKYTIYGSTDGSTWTSIESGITAGTKNHAITGAYTYFKIANTTAATAQLAITTLTITYETAGGETPGEGEEPTPDPEDPTPGTGGEALSYTWDLSTNSYSAASNTQVTWSATDVNMVADKGAAGTAPNNYLGGDANNRTSSRFYGNSILTITPEANVTITSVVFTATSTSYASALQGSTWTNASASVSGTTVTVTPTNGASAISATISGTCGFTGVTVNYTKTGTGSTEQVVSLTADPTTIDFGTVYEGATVADTTVAVNFENLTGNVTYSGLSTPFSATGNISTTGDKITISADASTIGEYSQTLTIQSAADSKSVDVTVTMNVVKAPVPTGTFELYSGELTEGDYVFVVDNVAMTNTVSSKRLSNTSVTITEDKIENPSENIIWHVAQSGEYWTIFNEAENAYAASTGVKNNAQMLADGTDDKVLWSVAEIENAFNFENKSNKAASINAKLQRNGEYGWACYAEYSNISLYKKSDGKQPAGLAYETNKYLVKLGAFITPTLTNPNLLVVTYSSSDNNVAEVAADGKVTTKAVGTVEITATFAGNETHREGSAKYTICVTEHAGTQADPYSVADARRVIDVMETAEGVYATGIVSEIVTAYNEQYGNISYNISADGLTTSDQLQAYRGKSYDGANFTSADDVKVGDEVVIKGTLKKFSTTYEFDENNQLVSLNRTKEQAGLAYAETEHNANVGEDFAEPALTNPNNLTVTYSSSNSTLATVNATTGEVTILAAGKVTITASTTGNASYSAGSASYNITITDPSLAIATLPFYFDGKRADIEGTAGMTQSNLGTDYAAAPYLKFNEEGAWAVVQFDSEPGEFSFLLEQNGSNAGTFTVYESANGEDYTSIWSGGDLGGNEKSATIEPTLSATARYVKFEYTTKPTGTNYGLGEISIKKADHRQEASLVWNPSSVTLTQGDAFTAPKLQNPKYVAGITYESSNDEVATVTAGGEIALASAIGTATITATFAGDGTYKPATATCTITVNEYIETIDGEWQLVTDASKLQAGMEIIIASVEVDGKYYAMSKASDNGNNRTAVESTISGDKLNPALGTSVLTLVDAGNGTFALQAGNGKYLYAASSTSNHLKEKDEIDVNGQWTITIADNVATIKAEGSSNRNWMQFNPNNGSPLFSCYAYDKPQKDIALYAKVPEHSRSTSAGRYGTICLPGNIVKCLGATLYEVAGKDGNKVIFDEVLTPEEGMPYIFLAHNAEVLFFCGDQTAAEGNHNSLYGTFSVLQDEQLKDMYMVQNNKIVKCAATGCGVAEYRAYFNGGELEALGKPGAQMPGRRRITMGTESENTATGTEDVVAPKGQTLKLIENGQLIIIRNGEKFNAQGVRL